MQKDSRLFEDMAKLAGSAATGLHTLKKEIEILVHQQVESVLRGMNMVTTEESEGLRAMVATLREEQEALKKRVAELEAHISEGNTGQAERSKKKKP